MISAKQRQRRLNDSVPVHSTVYFSHTSGASEALQAPVFKIRSSRLDGPLTRLLCKSFYIIESHKMGRRYSRPGFQRTGMSERPNRLLCLAFIDVIYSSALKAKANLSLNPFIALT